MPIPIKPFYRYDIRVEIPATDVAVQTERLALDLAWDAEAQAPVDRGIDMKEARRRWKELPEWVRSSLTNQGAGLGGAGQPP